jgi:hypothetical protein
VKFAVAPAPSSIHAGHAERGSIVANNASKRTGMADILTSVALAEEWDGAPGEGERLQPPCGSTNIMSCIVEAKRAPL